MKKIHLTATMALAALALAAANSHGATAWVGGVDDDFFDGDNWDNGFPDTTTNTGTIDSGTPVMGLEHGNFSQNINASVTQTGGDVSSDISWKLLSGTWDLQGGSFDVTANNLVISGTATFIVDGGTFTSSGGDVRVEQTGSELQLLSDTTLSGFINGYHGNVLIDNASVTAERLALGQFNTTSSFELTLQNGASLALTDGTNALRDYSTDDNTRISFGAGASSLTTAGWSSGTDINIDFAQAANSSTFTVSSGALDEAGWIAQWNAGKLTVDGGNAGSFSDWFEVNGDTLTMVPEPSAFALLLGGFALLMSRRRRR